MTLDHFASRTDSVRRRHRRRLIGVIVSGAAFALAALPNADAQGEMYKIAPVGASGLGYRVAALGDLNGDGLADFAVGTGSTTFVYSGVDHSVLRQLPNGMLASIGDANLDGLADLAIYQNGNVRLFSAANGVELWARTISASDIASVGDFDGDGRADVAGIASGAVGSLFVLSGLNGSTLKSLNVSGSLVRSGHDINQDSTPDFLIARPDVWLVQVVSGVDGKPLVNIALSPTSPIPPPSIALFDDVDGDAISDFAVGEPAFLSGTGRVRAFSGKTGGLLWQTVGNYAGGQFGRNLVTIADVNGDGGGDLLANANRDAATPDKTSSVSALSGNTGAIAFKVFSTDSYDGFGDAMAATGDINGDQRPDFVVGEFAGTWQQYNSGIAYVYSSRCWDQYVDYPGCPGSNGLSPTLKLTDCLTPLGTGNLQVSDAVGSMPGLLLAAPTTSTTQIAPGCWLRLNPASAISVPFVTSGAPVPGFGAYSLQLPMPTGVTYKSFFFQAIVADPAATHGFEATNGLLITD